MGLKGERTSLFGKIFGRFSYFSVIEEFSHIPKINLLDEVRWLLLISGNMLTFCYISNPTPKSQYTVIWKKLITKVMEYQRLCLELKIPHWIKLHRPSINYNNPEGHPGKIECFYLKMNPVLFNIASCFILTGPFMLKVVSFIKLSLLFKSWLV